MNQSRDVNINTRDVNINTNTPTRDQGRSRESTPNRLFGVVLSRENSPSPANLSRPASNASAMSGSGEVEEFPCRICGK